MTAKHLAAVRRSASKQREWTGRRNDEIRGAVKAGYSLREVAEASGLSHSAVAKITRRPEQREQR